MTKFDQFMWQIRQLQSHIEELKTEVTDNGKHARIKEIRVLCHHLSIEAEYLEAAFLRKAKADEHR